MRNQTPPKPNGPLGAGQWGQEPRASQRLQKDWGEAQLCYLLPEAQSAAEPRLPHSTGNQGPGDKTPQMSWSNICTTFPAFTKKAFSTQATLGDELGRQSRESPLKLTL